MRTARALLLASLTLAACRLEHASSGRPPGPPTEADSLARVEQDSSLDAQVQAALRAYFDRLSARDWRGVRGQFTAAAIVVTPSFPQGEKVDDYLRKPPEESRGSMYAARLLHVHVTGYGDVADAWAIYETRWGLRRDSLRTQRAIGAFHFSRERGTWRIASLAIAPEQSSRPLSLPPRRPARKATPAGSGPRSGA